MWKDGQKAQEIPHVLLNTWFAEYELEKQGIVAKTSPTANDQGKSIMLGFVGNGISENSAFFIQFGLSLLNLHSHLHSQPYVNALVPNSLYNSIFILGWRI
jgi:hypothetical protein